ncbi:MAG: flagellin-like hook-associated protein FlgL [Parvibaculaceae bacterium]|jgi:flagellin
MDTMAEVVLSGAMRSNLLSLQNTSNLLDQTQSRLSTGLKVNGAIDDPTAFFTSRTLSTRASDLNELLDNMNLATETLNTADEGIQSILTLVETMKATANEALDTPIVPSYIASDRELISAGTMSATAMDSGLETSDVITIEVTGVITSIQLSNMTVDELVSSISAISGATADISIDGALRIEADDGRELIIGSSAGDIAADLKLEGTYDNGTNHDKFEADFNELRIQIDELAGDASYKGVNILTGDDLTVNFNEDQTSQLVIRGADLTVGGDLSISEVTGSAWESESSISLAVAELDAAKETLRTQASTFGGNMSVVEVRSDFTDQLIVNLETGAAELTIADLNEESANLLALQTRQSLATTALSIASQAEQNVLQLF